MLSLCILSDHISQQKHTRRESALRRAREIQMQRGERAARGEANEHEHEHGHEHGHHHHRSQEDDHRHHKRGLGAVKDMFGASDKQKEEETNELRRLFAELDNDMQQNRHGGIRWIKDKLLKELPGQAVNRLLDRVPPKQRNKKGWFVGDGKMDFTIKRKWDAPMIWEERWNQMTDSQREKGPRLDYTKHDYEYLDLQASPPDEYPFMEPMDELMKRWPQDDLDNPPTPFVEQLMHFNFSDPKQRKMAINYRDAELPFKVYDVPELIEAGKKWTDEYVASNFDGDGSFFGHKNKMPRSNGNCQESHDNFFAFFTPMGWHMSSMGPPPYRNNDWTYEKWAKHARYADATSLSFDQPHFYWQSGIPKTERFDPEREWTFVSRDLPSFSSVDANFFVFHPDEQKGIQCRFGERGVTAATHYDAGRNMVGMIKGAKRYILSPPKECSKLGIVTARGNSLFRHSLLNFGHIPYLDTDQGNDMPDQERGWLERSRTAMSVETVLKAGEVLYIPSHWFHYINSVQKSAQCNVRSGVDEVGTRSFGGSQDVYDCNE